MSDLVGQKGCPYSVVHLNVHSFLLLLLLGIQDYRDLTGCAKSMFQARISLAQLPRGLALGVLSAEFLLLGVLQYKLAVSLKSTFVGPLVYALMLAIKINKDLGMPLLSLHNRLSNRSELS